MTVAALSWRLSAKRPGEVPKRLSREVLLRYSIGEGRSNGAAEYGAGRGLLCRYDQ